MKTFRDLKREIQLGDILCRTNSDGITLLLVVAHNPRTTFAHGGMIQVQVLRQDGIPENIGDIRWSEQSVAERAYSPITELSETLKKSL